MKKLAVLCLAAAVSCPALCSAQDVNMRTWVHAPSGITASYPDFFWLSKQSDDASDSSTTLNLRSADGKLELDLLVMPRPEESTEQQLASCMEDGLVVPGSARYGEKWFKLTLLQDTTLRSIFVRQNDKYQTGFTFARPLGDERVDTDLLYNMQKALKFESADTLSDRLTGDIQEQMEWMKHFQLTPDLKGFCKVGSTEVLGEARPLSGFNFDKWRYFVVTEETPGAGGDDAGVWLMRPASLDAVDTGFVMAHLPFAGELEDIGDVSLSADGSYLMLDNHPTAMHQIEIYDFRTLRRVHSFESSSIAGWIDSSRYVYTEEAPISRYLPVQTGGVGSVLCADLDGSREVLIAATDLDDFELQTLSTEEQKMLILHQHAHSTEDWGTWEHVDEEMLVLGYPD